MDDRCHFATLILANQLGVLSKERVIASADQRIIELEKPENWLMPCTAAMFCCTFQATSMAGTTTAAGTRRSYNGYLGGIGHSRGVAWR